MHAYVKLSQYKRVNNSTRCLLGFTSSVFVHIHSGHRSSTDLVTRKRLPMPQFRVYILQMIVTCT